MGIVKSVFKCAAGEVISTQPEENVIRNSNNYPEFSVYKITASRGLLGGYKVTLMECMDPGSSDAQGPYVKTFRIGTFPRDQALKLKDVKDSAVVAVAHGDFKVVYTEKNAAKRAKDYRKNVTNFLTSQP